MGPFIPSITLTTATDVTLQLLNNEIFCPLWDANVPGSKGLAMTDKGRLVKVWKPAPNNPINVQYFCHGASLGTYRKYGYSVLSGKDILIALEDDYVEIGVGKTRMDALQLVKAGDIISLGSQREGIEHTVVVKLFMPIVYRIGRKSFDAIQVSSKNGTFPELVTSFSATCVEFLGCTIFRYWRSKRYA